MKVTIAIKIILLVLESLNISTFAPMNRCDERPSDR
jgi:hypothetical protein